MNKLSFKIIALILIMPFVCTPAFAKGKAKPTPVPRTEQDRVLAVSDISITIGNEKHSKTYTVVPGTAIGATEVYVNAQKATIRDVKVGMAASVSAGLSGDTASLINAHNAPTTAPVKK